MASPTTADAQDNTTTTPPAHPNQHLIQAPKEAIQEEVKEIKFLNGVAVSIDLAGAVMYKLANYGQLEGQLRLNLKEKYFPVMELGIGHSDHTDEETDLYFKTNSPYIRIGCDYNFNKDLQSKNRIYGGFRYAFTTCKFDLSGKDMTDPVWGVVVPFQYSGVSTNASWLEFVFGLEAKIYKRLHIGWSARYKMRMSQSVPSIGQAWYLPGFGINDSHNFSGTFNIIFDI